MDRKRQNPQEERDGRLRMRGIASVWDADMEPLDPCKQQRGDGKSGWGCDLWERS